MTTPTPHQLQAREKQALCELAHLCIAAERILLDPDAATELHRRLYPDSADQMFLDSNGEPYRGGADAHAIRGARYRTGDVLRALNVRGFSHSAIADMLQLTLADVISRLGDRNLGVNADDGALARLCAIPHIITGDAPSPLPDTDPLDRIVGSVDAANPTASANHGPLLPGRMHLTDVTWSSYLGDTIRRVLHLPPPTRRAHSAARAMWHTPAVAAAVDSYVRAEVWPHYRRQLTDALNAGAPRVVAFANAAHAAYVRAVKVNVDAVVLIDGLVRCQPDANADTIAAQVTGDQRTPQELNDLPKADDVALIRANGLPG